MGEESMKEINLQFVRHLAKVVYQEGKVQQKDETNEQDRVKSQSSKYSKMFRKIDCNYIIV